MGFHLKIGKAVMQKIAIKAYKFALKEISKAKTKQDVEEVIIELVAMVNTLPNIETVEREDIGLAIQQLVEASTLDIDQETVNTWFDEIRDF